MLTDEDIDIIECSRNASQANSLTALYILRNPKDPGREQALHMLGIGVESLVAMVDDLLAEVKRTRKES